MKEGRCSLKIKAESSELVVNKLRAYGFYQPNPIIRKGFENEMINADNLPRIIFNLKKQNPYKFELLKDVYFQLFPDIEG